MKRFNLVDTIALSLLVIGGLNWGLVGIFQFDLVATLFGEATILARTVYSVVGLSALYIAAIYIPKAMKLIGTVVKKDDEMKHDSKLRRVA